MAPGLDEFDVLLEVVLSLVRLDRNMCYVMFYELVLSYKESEFKRNNIDIYGLSEH